MNNSLQSTPYLNKKSMMEIDGLGMVTVSLQIKLTADLSTVSGY